MTEQEEWERGRELVGVPGPRDRGRFGWCPYSTLDEVPGQGHFTLRLVSSPTVPTDIVRGAARPHQPGASVGLPR